MSLLTKEEEAEINQQAEEIKTDLNNSISCLLWVVFLIVEVLLLLFFGVLGWYFLLGGIFVIFLIGINKHLK